MNEGCIAGVAQFQVGGVAWSLVSFLLNALSVCGVFCLLLHSDQHDGPPYL